MNTSQTITNLLYVWIVGEWIATRKSLCYLLFLIAKDKNILYNYIAVGTGIT